MRKYCIVGEIKPEYLDEYIKKHKHLHQSEHKELLNVIKKSGVKNEVIFMYKNLAIIYFEAEDLSKSYDLQSKFEVTGRWNKVMAPMFASDYGFGKDPEKLEGLEKIFDLQEQLNGELLK